MRTIKTVLASLGVMGLLIGNTAAASTRSYEAVPQAGLELDSMSRAFAPMTDASYLNNEDEDDGSGTILLVLAGVLFAAGIFFLVDNDDDDVDSPG